MNPNHEKVGEALKSLTDRYAVAYLQIDPLHPVACAFAGLHQGRAFYTNGIQAHLIGDNIKTATIKTNSVEFRDREDKLGIYVTLAEEAGEVQLGDIIKQVDQIREIIEEQGGLSSILPKGES